MKPVTIVALRLTPLQFVAIRALLENTCLGDRNEYESEISDLMIKLDNEGADTLVKRILSEQRVSFPQLMVECGTDIGMTINLV